MMKFMVAAGLVLGGGVAFAQTAPPQVVRGVIESVNATGMVLAGADGGKMNVGMPAGVVVLEIVPASLADVKPGSFIGTAAVKTPGGQYRAMELQLFPDSMRGVGLGTRKWNLTKTSTMTNGTVGAMSHPGGTVGSVAGNGDETLNVNDGSGEKTVVIPSGVPVVTYQPGSAADLKPGAHVLLFADKGADGALTAEKVTVGKDGLVPPM